MNWNAIRILQRIFSPPKKRTIGERTLGKNKVQNMQPPTHRYAKSLCFDALVNEILSATVDHSNFSSFVNLKSKQSQYLFETIVINDVKK